MGQFTKITGSTKATTQSFDFGTTDKRGRKVGCIVSVYEKTYELTDENNGYIREPGTYLVFHPWATRDGQAYGAIQHERHFTNEEERTAAIAKYVKDARKRASK